MGGKSSSQFVTFGNEDYERCRFLGKGSFGKVYAVQHFATGTFRVVKEMNKGSVLQHKMSSNVKREREFLSELKGCPYVVKCYAAEQDDYFLYLLLEFCSGGELRYHFQERGKFSEDEIRGFLAQIGVGLEIMHTKFQIVHRDLKPSNILLDEKGYCAIADFNMATKCDQNLFVPNPNHHVVGTLPYTAPELMEGQDHTNKVDYWSLGIMAYEFAYGKRPYIINKEENEKKMLHTIQNTPISSILNSSVSNDLNDLIRGLLQKNPAKRFDSQEFKNHKFFDGIDWDAVCEKKIQVPILPREDKIYFHADYSNIEEIFGLSNPKEAVNALQQQKHFESWDWLNDNQELPLPDPKRLRKLSKKKKKNLSNTKKKKNISYPTKKGKNSFPSKVSCYTSELDTTTIAERN